MSEMPTLLIRCVERPETNAYFTLANMATADPKSFAEVDRIYLISGDNKTGFLSSLKAMNKIEVYCADKSAYDKIAKWAPKRRGAWSYSVALRVGEGTGRDCIVMEDDITFSNEWLFRMMARVERIRSVEKRPFVLSAYHRYALKSERGYEPVPTLNLKNAGTHFWGNLCTFWSKELIPGFREFFNAIINKQENVCTDVNVHLYCTRVNAPFFVTVPSLVQHLGDKTTLRADGIRRTPMFESFKVK